MYFAFFWHFTLIEFRLPLIQNLLLQPYSIIGTTELSLRTRAVGGNCSCTYDMVEGIPHWVRRRYIFLAQSIFRGCHIDFSSIYILDLYNYLFRNQRALSISISCKALDKTKSICHSTSCGDNYSMVTSSNGKIFRITGPLWGESTGHRLIPLTKPVTRSFEVFFDPRLNKRFRKQSKGWWLETSPRSLWRTPDRKHYFQ